MTYEQMEKQDKELAAQGILKGRFIAEHYADGFAYYKIVRVNKKTVRIEHVSVGDGWVIPYWGLEASISKDYVINQLRFQDMRYKIGPMKLFTK